MVKEITSVHIYRCSCCGYEWNSKEGTYETRKKNTL